MQWHRLCVPVMHNSFLNKEYISFITVNNKDAHLSHLPQVCTHVLCVAGLINRRWCIMHNGQYLDSANHVWNQQCTLPSFAYKQQTLKHSWQEESTLTECYMLHQIWRWGGGGEAGWGGREAVSDVNPGGVGKVEDDLKHECFVKVVQLYHPEDKISLTMFIVYSFIINKVL